MNRSFLRAFAYSALNFSCHAPAHMVSDQQWRSDNVLCSSWIACLLIGGTTERWRGWHWWWGGQEVSGRSTFVHGWAITVLYHLSSSLQGSVWKWNFPMNFPLAGLVHRIPFKTAIALTYLQSNTLRFTFIISLLLIAKDVYPLHVSPNYKILKTLRNRSFEKLLVRVAEAMSDAAHRNISRHKKPII